jgi:lipid A ethanolaminephosphotransferase
MVETKQGSQAPSKEWWWPTLQALLLLLLVYMTNNGFIERVTDLYQRGKWLVLSVFLAIWALTFIAVMIAAVHPRRSVRWFWGLLIALTTTAAYSFYLASGTDLNLYYMLSLWAARHEADRAIEFYQHVSLQALIVFVTTVAIFCIPTYPSHGTVDTLVRRLWWVPCVPVLALAGILLVRNGSGSQAMPRQIQPLSIGIVAAGYIMSKDPPERQQVEWTAETQKTIRNIILLVDESIRPDYIDWTVGNTFTPRLASLKDQISNFGQAVSGGNCSSFSNAIIRFGGTRKNLVKSVSTNPTIWQYAKAAGYRTVYIDAQSPFVKSSNKLQNFMTFEELKSIDRHVTFENVEAPQLDFELLKEVGNEINGAEPVFILANKNGAHFPYHHGYPTSEAVFQPITSDANTPRLTARINSYRNVIRWSVDRFFADLLSNLDLAESLVLYTSDHGQLFKKDRLSHCTVENPDVREALVPLMAMTGNPDLKSRLDQAAKQNYSRLSHFAIVPTILELMGYRTKNIEEKFEPTIFRPRPSDYVAAFTPEYIFGLFKSDVRWFPVDLSVNYLEKNANPPSN